MPVRLQVMESIVLDVPPGRRDASDGPSPNGALAARRRHPSFHDFYLRLRLVPAQNGPLRRPYHLDDPHPHANLGPTLQFFLIPCQHRDLVPIAVLLTLTRADVQQYLQHLQNERKSASSLHTTYYAIAAWCRASGQTQATLSIRLPGRPRITALPVKSLDRSERNQLLRDVERDSNHRGNNRDTAIVYLLLFAGLRVSKLVNLDIEDVKIGERSGSVRVLGKGNKERVVPLAAEARHWLTRYIGERSTGTLFLSNRKTRIHPNTIQKMLAQYGTHPHALRHTFGRTLAAAGADLPVIARLMGHEDVNVTMRYALPSENELAEAMDRVFT